MRNFGKLLVVSVLAAIGLVQASEKQSFTIAQPLVAVDWTQIAPPQKNTPVPVSASLTEDQATRLVHVAFGAQVDLTNHAFMVHAVQYQSGKIVAANQKWYTIDLYKTPGIETAGDLHLDARYKDPRIFGRSHLGLVYLHILEAASAAEVEKQLRGEDAAGMIMGALSPPAATSTRSAADVMAADISSSITAITNLDQRNKKLGDFQKRLNALRANIATTPTDTTSFWKEVTAERVTVELLNKGVSGQISLTAADGAQLVLWNGYFVKNGFDGLSTLAYTVDVTSKDKAPFSNLKQIIGLAIGAQSLIPAKIKINLSLTPFAAGGLFDTTLTTSDLVVTANYSSAGKDTQIGTQTYDNEGRYWYDFSLVLPIKSYNDLAYDSTASGLTARKIQKNNLFAAFNFGVPRDTKNMKFQVIPVLLYGIPITGQPLKHHLFAGSLGLNYVNFFVGTSLDAKNFYHDFTKPLTGDNVFRAWRTHLTYGLNFDVSTVVKALSKSSK